jgi:hypothetical protein
VIYWGECELRTAQLAGFASENRLQSCADCRVLENRLEPASTSTTSPSCGLRQGLIVAGARPIAGFGRILAVPVDRQQQSLGQDIGADAAARRLRADRIQAPGPQHSLLEHVHRRHHAPAPQNLGLDATQVTRSAEKRHRLCLKAAYRSQLLVVLTPIAPLVALATTC